MNKKSLKLLAIIPLVGFALSANAEDTTTRHTKTTTTDKSASTSSPGVLDQSSGTAQDVEVTRAIREELSKSDSLSTSAKNVEVITLNNAVTLRGAVGTTVERNEVISKAQRAAGNRAIKNEIIVDASRR